jgi:hypothetical protein
MTISKIDSKSFLEEATKNAEPSLKESLELGETGWLQGTPSKSEAGTIALKTRSGFLIIVSEDDVVEYAQQEHEYFIRVKNGSDVITRFESVNKLLPSKPTEQCDCAGQTNTSVEKRVNQQSGGPPDRPIIVFGCFACRIEYQEAWCQLPGGILFKCYQPVIKCGNVCPPPVIV